MRVGIVADPRRERQSTREKVKICHERWTIEMAIDQGAATLAAAGIAAFASTLAVVVPLCRDWRRSRKLKRRLVEMLSGDQKIRSLEWLARSLGVSECDVKAMLRDIEAHGVLMKDGKEGAALDSRHVRR